MAPNDRSGDLFYFGAFELSREEIQQLVWSDSTVVDFSIGINRCVRQIRSALLDDADAPRYLKTIPRVGYRFVAPVETPADHESPLPDNSPLPSPVAPPVAPLRSVQNEKSRNEKRFIPAYIAFGVVLAATIYWIAKDHRKHPIDLRIVPLAVSLGDQYTPTFSPDGRQVAFTWNGDEQANFDIYLKLANSSGPPLRLTTNKDVDYSPAWSPDGEWIAFCRGTDTSEGALWVIPALGGAERKVVDLSVSASPWTRALSWTPDSKRLIVAAPVKTGGPLSLEIVELSTGVKTVLTRPTASDEDMHPACLGDAEWIAVGRSARRHGVHSR